jgi:hypothetical protein
LKTNKFDDLEEISQLPEIHKLSKLTQEEIIPTGFHELELKLLIKSLPSESP